MRSQKLRFLPLSRPVGGEHLNRRFEMSRNATTMRSAGVVLVPFFQRCTQCRPGATVDPRGAQCARPSARRSKVWRSTPSRGYLLNPGGVGAGKRQPWPVSGAPAARTERSATTAVEVEGRAPANLLWPEQRFEVSLVGRSIARKPHRGGARGAAKGIAARALPIPSAQEGRLEAV